MTSRAPRCTLAVRATRTTTCEHVCPCGDADPAASATPAHPARPAGAGAVLGQADSPGRRFCGRGSCPAQGAGFYSVGTAPGSRPSPGLGSCSRGVDRGAGRPEKSEVGSTPLGPRGSRGAGGEEAERRPGGQGRSLGEEETGASGGLSEGSSDAGARAGSARGRVSQDARPSATKTCDGERAACDRAPDPRETVLPSARWRPVCSEHAGGGQGGRRAT